MITDERNTTDGYDPEAAWDRIGVILDRDSIEESDTLPARLHGPGAVVRGTVLFVDVRESHDLARSYRPARLARLYRALVSELITILTDPLVRHVGTTGDRVWAISDTPTGADAATMHRAAELAHHAGRTDRLPVDVGSGFAAHLDDSARRTLDEQFRPDPDDQGSTSAALDSR